MLEKTEDLELKNQGAASKKAAVIAEDEIAAVGSSKIKISEPR